MITTSQTQTAADVAQKLNDADQLEKPVLTPDARDFLLREGWDALFSWARDEAPAHIFGVLRCVNYLEYVNRESNQNGGLISKDENETMPVMITELLNTLGELHRL